MTAVFIQILKKKNYIRRIIHLVTIQKACAKNHRMVLDRKAETTRLVGCINMALKAKRLYKNFKLCFGQDLLYRYKNHLRKVITF